MMREQAMKYTRQVGTGGLDDLVQNTLMAVLRKSRMFPILDLPKFARKVMALEAKKMMDAGGSPWPRMTDGKGGRRGRPANMSIEDAVEIPRPWQPIHQEEALYAKQVLEALMKLGPQERRIMTRLAQEYGVAEIEDLATLTEEKALQVIAICRKRLRVALKLEEPK